jgi:hypothetical protein
MSTCLKSTFFDAAYVPIALQGALTPEQLNALRFTSFTKNVERAWENQWWPINKTKPNSFVWFDENKSEKNVFEVAIWHANTLCGLAEGRLGSAKSREEICLTVTEGAPFKHPLKGFVTSLAIEAARAFGRAHGKTHLVLQGPFLNPKGPESFEKAGFRRLAGREAYDLPLDGPFSWLERRAKELVM